MYTIESMIKKAQKDGHASEDTMWVTVKSLEKIKDKDPQLYWDLARDMHEALYHGHYSEEYANYDLSNIFYIDKSGNKIMGPYWTVTDIEGSTKSMSFPPGTNKWDKYVAFNVFRTDLALAFNDEEVLRGAYEFFFNDADFKKEGTTKIWEYMECVR